MRGARHLTNQTDEWSASAHERGARHLIEKGTKERSFAQNGFWETDGRTCDENMTVCSFAVGAFCGAIMV